MEPDHDTKELPEIAELRALLADESINCVDVARKADVSYKTIMNIKNGKALGLTLATYKAVRDALIGQKGAPAVPAERAA